MINIVKSNFIRATNFEKKKKTIFNVLALRTFPNSTGGSFFCQINAQQTALPAAQPISPTRYITGPSFPQRGYVPAQRPQQYQPPYQQSFTPPGVRFEQGFQPTFYTPGGFQQQQSRPQTPSTYYQPSYQPSYQQSQPSQPSQPSQQPQRVQNGYQAGYQSGFQTGYQQNIYPIGEQKPIYNGYTPTQQVYRYRN